MEKTIRKITIIRPENRKKGDPQLIIENPTHLKLIGNGGEGAVFRLSEDKCVKVYAKEFNAKKEQDALKAIIDLPFTPQIYGMGSNYLVMEYIRGISLKEYIKKNNKLPIFITKQILTMLGHFKRVGFSRIDARLEHLFITKTKKIKAIDHVNANLTVSKYPVKLLNDLRKLGQKNTFLNQVKQLKPKLYKNWRKQMKAY